MNGEMPGVSITAPGAIGGSGSAGTGIVSASRDASAAPKRRAMLSRPSAAEHERRAADHQRRRQEPAPVDVAGHLGRSVGRGRHVGRRSLRLRRPQQPAQHVRRRERAADRRDHGQHAPGRAVERGDGSHGSQDHQPVEPDPRTAHRDDAQHDREDGDHRDHPDHQRALVVRAERPDRERLQPFGCRVDRGVPDGHERGGLVVDERGEHLGDPQGEGRGQQADRRPAEPSRPSRQRRRGR